MENLLFLVTVIWLQIWLTSVSLSGDDSIVCLHMENESVNLSYMMAFKRPMEYKTLWSLKVSTFLLNNRQIWYIIL